MIAVLAVVVGDDPVEAVRLPHFGEGAGRPFFDVLQVREGEAPLLLGGAAEEFLPHHGRDKTGFDPAMMHVSRE